MSTVKTSTIWTLIDTLLTAPINPGTYRICLSGKPGIGKTVTPIKTMRADGLTVYVLTITEEMSMSELRGHFVMKDDNFIWMDGPLTRAWRDSATRRVAVIINEIDKAAGDVFTFFHQYLDDHDTRNGAAEMHLPTGEVLRPTPWNIRYIATMNGAFKDLPDPIQSRFPVNLEVNEVHPDALAALPEDLRDLAKHMTETTVSGRSLSVREFHAFAALRNVIPKEDAATAIFGASAKDILAAIAVATLV